MKNKMVTTVSMVSLLFAVILFAGVPRSIALSVHDIAVIDIQPSKTVVGQGFTMKINVTAQNQGDFTETFNVTLKVTRPVVNIVQYALNASFSQGWNLSIPGPALSANRGDLVRLTLKSLDSSPTVHNFYADYSGDGTPSLDEPKSPDFNQTAILYEFTPTSAGTFTYYCQYHQLTMHGTFTVNEPPLVVADVGVQPVTLSNGTSTVLTFSWNTTGFIKAVYAVSAEASVVLDEVDTSDNTLIDGNVSISIIGDITGPTSGVPDGKVDIRDIATTAKAFGSVPGHPNWYPNSDITGPTTGVPDNKVDIRDIATIAKEFGKTATLHDVAVLNVVPLSASVTQGSSVNISVTVANQGDFPETFTVRLFGSRSDTVVRSMNLFGSALSPAGWGFTAGSITSPGPTITVKQGDLVNLTLTSQDGLPHRFFVDYNANGLLDAGEPASSTFSTTVNFQFTASTLGTFTYFCQIHPSTMFGTFVVQTPTILTTELGTQGTTLSPATSTTLSFAWNTTGFAKDTYTIKAVADTVMGEIDTADNSFTDGTITIV